MSTAFVLPPKVSIIIPVYNLESIVPDCIECCIQQTFKDIEIVIVNDGSTDGSGNIIDRYKEKDPRIKHIRKQNEGLSFARKTGTQHASGEFIFHLDGDDTIPQDAIENLYQQAVTDAADIIAGNILVCKTGAKKEEYYSNFGIGTGTAFLEYILIHQLHYVWGKLIKRSLFTSHPIEVIQEVKVIGEDQMLMYQLCMFACKVTTINRIVYHYRINDHSITKRPMQNQQFTVHQEHYAAMLFNLQQRFQYNRLVKQQLNLRILKALYEGLHRTGHYVVNRQRSASIMGRTLIISIFSKSSLLFSHYALLARCTAAMIFPGLAFKLKSSGQ